MTLSLTDVSHRVIDYRLSVIENGANPLRERFSNVTVVLKYCTDVVAFYQLV